MKFCLRKSSYNLLKNFITHLLRKINTDLKALLKKEKVAYFEVQRKRDIKAGATATFLLHLSRFEGDVCAGPPLGPTSLGIVTIPSLRVHISRMLSSRLI